MFSLIWLLIGLFLGWFFLPTPAWASALLAKVVEKFPLIGAFVKKQ